MQPELLRPVAFIDFIGWNITRIKSKVAEPKLLRLVAFIDYYFVSQYLIYKLLRPVAFIDFWKS